MFLSLELPGGDKGVSIFVRDLAGDENFAASEPFSWEDWDGERRKADWVIQEANRALGTAPSKAFNALFNQFRWPAVTGWEYWSRDYQLMLKHALTVAQALALPLHVHVSVMEAIIEAATSLEIEFDYAPAQPVVKPKSEHFSYSNKQLAAGEYWVLTELSLKTALPLISF